MAKILITGGCGFIGTHLAKELKNQGQKVFIMDLPMLIEKNYFRGDVCRSEEIEEVFKQEKFDYVYHLAGMVGRYNSEAYPLRCIDVNLRGIINIIQKCLEYNTKLIFTSSSEVYGDIEVPLEENLTGLKPINIYGLTKLQTEEIISYYTRKYNLKAMIFRIINCYGPGEYPNFFRSVLTNYFYAAMHDQPMLVHKGCFRAWCYIDDIVRGLSLATSHFKNDEIYNLGKDELSAIEDLAKMTCDLAGKSHSLIYYLKRGNFDVRTKKPVIKKIKNDLNFEAKIGLEEGLKRTYEWHKKIYQEGFKLTVPIFKIPKQAMREKI